MSFRVSMQNRAFRAHDGWPVFMRAGGVACCRGVRHHGGRASHREGRRPGRGRDPGMAPAQMIIRQGRPEGVPQPQRAQQRPGKARAIARGARAVCTAAASAVSALAASGADGPRHPLPVGRRELAGGVAAQRLSASPQAAQPVLHRPAATPSRAAPAAARPPPWGWPRRRGPAAARTRSGSSTWVRPHAGQRARAGCGRAHMPPGRMITRGRACPTVSAGWHRTGRPTGRLQGSCCPGGIGAQQHTRSGELVRLGFTRYSAQKQLQLAAHVSRWLGEAGFGTAELNARAVDGSLRHAALPGIAPRWTTHSSSFWHSTLEARAALPGTPFPAKAAARARVCRRRVNAGPVRAAENGPTP